MGNAAEPCVTFDAADPDIVKAQISAQRQREAAHTVKRQLSKRVSIVKEQPTAGASSMNAEQEQDDDDVDVEESSFDRVEVYAGKRISVTET